MTQHSGNIFNEYRSTGSKTQFSTFFVSKRLYGIDVKRVQEVVKPMPMTRIPLAQDYVCGLINLRGQVATAIGMRQLFEIPVDAAVTAMNVVCKFEGNLISLLVDDIGDVIEVSDDDFEPTPQTLPNAVRRFMSGVFKLNGPILSIIDVEKVSKFLNR